MTQQDPQPEIIDRLLDAVYPSFALIAGLELDLFSQLGDGPRDNQQLAEALGVRANKLRPLLYALVAAGLLTVEDDQFANTAEAGHFLVRGRPDYMGDLQPLVANNWERILHTAGTIRAGRPLREYDYQHDSQEALAAILRGLIPGTISDARRLLAQYDFANDRSLLDVGGGSGALAMAVAEAHSHLRVTIADLPQVTPVTKQFVAEANLSERIEIIAADMIQEGLPEAYDVVVARHFLQVLSAEACQALLQNLAAVVRRGGSLVLLGWVLDNSRLTPRKIVDYNLVLLNGYEAGEAYTEKEYFAWLQQAGFVAPERKVLDDDSSIITARRLA